MSAALAVAGVIVSSGIAALVVWARLRRVVVPRVAEPLQGTIYVGVEPGCGIPLGTVHEAVAVWKQLGHQLTDPAVGEGMITIRAWEPGLAAKQGRPGADGMHIEGDIYVSRPSVLLLAHELGHALGYSHPRNAPTGHLMHHLPSRRGFDTRGLETS